ncbi:uncharacterized protein LOC128989327 [Macrosteles quadrilineatus]|uniref:uncharacterized protein LOC128989327 n=1 Tax=Macrosteles quadrilineatus TaxID=74068 RepID=UPI0023E25B99|nr:uncharacterized protein LOC128989327 [Macrosteles quadrilineatus]
MITIKLAAFEFCLPEKKAAMLARIELNASLALYSAKVPDGNLNIFLESLENIIVSLSKYNLPIVICGDINIDVLVEGIPQKYLDNLLRSVDCLYINKEPTRGLKCLDNVITNLPRDNIHVNVSLPPLSDHAGLIVEVMFTQAGTDKELGLHSKIDSRLFNKANVANFVKHVSAIDWSFLNNVSNGRSFELFMEKFREKLDLCIPIKPVKKNPHVKRRGTGNAWFTNDLRQLREETLTCYHNLLWASKYNINVGFFKQTYMDARKDYKAAIKDAKLHFNAKFIESSSNKCKTAWSVINSARISSSKAGVVPITADEFNHYFISSVADVQKTVNLNQPASTYLLNNFAVPEVTFRWKPVSCDDVAKLILNMKSGNSKDIYGINSDFVKEVAHCIVAPLTHCINDCFTSGVYPLCLKSSKTVPIYKKGDTSSPGSYRPISVVPCFSKIVESAMKHQLIKRRNCGGEASDNPRPPPCDSHRGPRLATPVAHPHH